MEKTTRAANTHTSSLSHYLQEISKTPLLTAQEEQDLARRIQEHNDDTARQKMIKANLRLVVNMGKRYAPSRDPDTLLDIIQDGNIGLLKAVDRFKPDRNTRFSTYAVYWIRQAILRALKARRLVRLPENVADQVLRLQRSRQSLYQVLGRDPSSEELAQEMQLPVSEIELLDEASAEVVSLDQGIRGKEEDDRTNLRDVIVDHDAPRPQQVAQTELARGLIVSAVESLPQREREILELRFGLGEKEPHTLHDIGNLFGISRERVRQLQNGALKRLRQRPAFVYVEDVA